MGPRRPGGRGCGRRAAVRTLLAVAYRTAYLIVHDAAAAEDIAQEAFLASIRALGRFDRRRPFGPWLTRIVANRSIDHARARALRREAFDEPALANAAAEGDGPGRPRPVLRGGAGRTCGPRPRAPSRVVLRYLLEYTPGEIAELLGLPRGTVNSRLRRRSTAWPNGCRRASGEAAPPPRGPPHTPAPGEHEAGDRARAVLLRAYAQRPPTTPPRRAPWRPLVLAACLLVAAAIVTPPGLAVSRHLCTPFRTTIAVAPKPTVQATPTTRLPAPGRLLLAGNGQAWILRADGTRRRVAAARDASWSPHGRFVLARGTGQLRALVPADGSSAGRSAAPTRSPPPAGRPATATASPTSPRARCTS